MKVKRLELKGFRGFDEIVLDFDTNPQRPTVFIGVNGVGKSSILDALAILLSWLIKKIEFAYTSRNELYSAEQITEKLLTDISLDGDGFDDKDVRVFSNKVTSNKVISKIIIDYEDEETQWILTGHPSTSINSQTSILRILGYDLDILDSFIIKIRNRIKEIPNEHLNLPIIVYYPVNRLINKIPLESQDSVLAKPIDPYKNALEKKGIDFQEFFQWFRNTEDLENEEIRDDANHKDKKLVAVREAVYSLIPEFDNLRVRRNPLRMTVNKNKQELTVDQLSDGEKCLLAMVGDIARRLAIANPSLDDPLQGEGIVLIDEIELHLHPQWQHKIIPRLTETFPNCQFIVTTHSPQVLSHVQPENIYILQSTPDGIIASQPESSYGRDSNQILENVMGVSAYPEDIEKDLSELFRLIERNDLVGAKQLREQLSSRMPGPSDPQLIKAGVIIKGKEILGK
jgi:predicted ATP-binding protein involved in virulence